MRLNMITFPLEIDPTRSVNTRVTPSLVQEFSCACTSSLCSSTMPVVQLRLNLPLPPKLLSLLPLSSSTGSLCLKISLSSHLLLEIILRTWNGIPSPFPSSGSLSQQSISYQMFLGWDLIYYWIFYLYQISNYENLVCLLFFTARTWLRS